MALADEQLALLLQAARDFAFQQLARDGGFLPFGARANADGEIDFVRFADEQTQEPLEEIFRRTQLALAEQAQKGEILAAVTVANVRLAEEDVEDGFDQAIQLHVEAPDYSRMILAPYRVEGNGGKPSLAEGELVALEAAAAVFA